MVQSWKNIQTKDTNKMIISMYHQTPESHVNMFLNPTHSSWNDDILASTPILISRICMLTCIQGRVLSSIFIQDYNALTPVYHGLFSVSLNMLVIITPINSSWMFGAILHQHLFCLVSCSVESIKIISCLILVFMLIIIIVLNNYLHVFLFFHMII